MRAELLGLVGVLVSALPARAAPPRLPVEAFFANPVVADVRVSPDGSHIAALASSRGQEYLVVAPASQAAALSPVVRFGDPRFRLTRLLWANDSRVVFGVEYPFDSTGVRARGTRLYAVNRDGSDRYYLGQRWEERIQIQDRIVSALRGDSDHILISLRARGSRFPSAQRVNVRKGRLASVVKGRYPIRVWLADPQGRVRVGIGGDRTNRVVVARLDEDSDFETLIEGDAYETPVFRVLGFAYDDPRKLYVASDHDGDRETAYEYDIGDKEFTRVLFSHPEVDVAGPLRRSRARQKVVAVGYVTDELEFHFLDEEAEREQALLDAALPDRRNAAISSSADGGIAVVRSASDTQPPVYYLYRREERTLDELFHAYPDVDPAVLAPMRPVSYPARDGLTVPGYLTLPPGLEARRLPVVVHPHGGPTARDVRRYDATVQFLANRGYAVLQMNFRGSSGYGARHQSAGYRRWGLEMQDDITDGVRWLIEQGIADPDRVAIYGGSYGGYAALMGLVKTPELFRCAASYAGVTDLLTMLNDDKWYAFDDHNVPLVGHTRKDRERLEATSPLRAVDRIRAPVLLGHGEMDERVHVKHAQKLAGALRSAGKPVELLVFEDETHGFSLEANRIRFYTALESFLERCLKPREPVPREEAVAD